MYRRLAAKRAQPGAAEGPTVTTAPFVRVTVQSTPPTAPAEKEGLRLSSNALAVVVMALILATGFAAWKLWPKAPGEEAAYAMAGEVLEAEIQRGAFGEGVKAIDVTVSEGKWNSSAYIYEVRAEMKLAEPLFRAASNAGLANHLRMAERVRILAQGPEGPSGGPALEAPPMLPAVIEMIRPHGEELVRNFKMEVRKVSGSWRSELVKGSLKWNPVTGQVAASFPAGAVVMGSPAGDVALSDYLSDSAKYVERRIVQREIFADLQRKALESPANRPAAEAPRIGAVESPRPPAAEPARVVVEQPRLRIPRLEAATAPSAATPVAVVQQAPAAPPTGRLERTNFVQENVLFTAQ